jgi:hypothetical protein
MISPISRVMEAIIGIVMMSPTVMAISSIIIAVVKRTVKRVVIVIIVIKGI